jgi:hypothetical protein
VSVGVELAMEALASRADLEFKRLDQLGQTGPNLSSLCRTFGIGELNCGAIEDYNYVLEAIAGHSPQISDQIVTSCMHRI